MTTKTKPCKPAATAGKPAKKPAANRPITIVGVTTKHLTVSKIGVLLEMLTAKEMAELLRARGIPIPKQKDEMIDRLAVWAIRDAGAFTLTLH